MNVLRVEGASVRGQMIDLSVVEVSELELSTNCLKRRQVMSQINYGG